MSGPESDGDPYPRLVRRGGGARRVIRKGVRRALGQDFYFAVLTAPVWLLLIGMAAVYAAANAAFAGLYLLQPGSLNSDGHFWSAFFMSVQQFSGTGLSEVHPTTPYAHALASSETFFGLVNLALMTGLLFDRVSRPTARVMFSNVAVITKVDGQPHFVFRAANQRNNQILEAQVQVTLAYQSTTAEGRSFRRFKTLKVVRSASPLFALSWTVLHPIDDDSPFKEATRESLLANETEVIILMSGVDETIAERVHARHSYLPHEILWDRRFVDVLSTDERGRRVVDYYRFHEVEDANS